jgi:hypothetical protein
MLGDVRHGPFNGVDVGSEGSNHNPNRPNTSRRFGGIYYEIWHDVKGSDE